MSNEDIVRMLKEKWDKNLALELYNQNIGFCKLFVDKYCLHGQSCSDYYQMAYIALVEAIKAFDNSKRYSFICYYKMYLNNLFYRYNQKNQFPFSCSVKDYTKIIIGEKEIDYCLFICNQTSEIDLAESKINASEIWRHLEDVLTPINYKIMHDFFVDGKTLTAIGKELGIGKERVRQRKLRVLKRLSNDPFFNDLR